MRARYRFIALFLVSVIHFVHSETYHPVGMISTPKVQVSWNRYHDVEQITKILKSLAKTYPQMCRLQSLGKSYEKRELWMMTITDFNRGKAEEKSAFWIDGGIHANEIQGPEVALYTIWYLLEMAEHNAFVKRLLEERVFYICPVFNPDSRVAHMQKANNTHMPRTGQIPRDDDGDGLIDEDGFDDLDGDGHITMMRIKDDYGNFKPDPDFPARMIEVSEGEKGQYRLLGAEGFDNDGDGRVNEDGDGYYDPNRNFAWNWQPEHVQFGSHHYPFSIIENRCIGDFIMAHPQIAGLQTYHNMGGMFLTGPGDKSKPYEPTDVSILDALAKKGEEMIPGYYNRKLAAELYTARGTEMDWAYGMLGITAFNNELFSTYDLFHKKQQGWLGDMKERFKFNKYMLFGDGFVPWREVDHPQYGKIEVGGFKKSWVRQPPSFMLEQECHRNMAFTFYHADQMPKVELKFVEAYRYKDEFFQVTTLVRNERMIPTRLAVDVKNGLTPPDLVIIDGKEIEVLTGLISNNPFFNHAQEQEKRPERIQISNLNGYGQKYIRWTLKGKGAIEVKVRSIKGGVHRRRFELGE